MGSQGALGAVHGEDAEAAGAGEGEVPVTGFLAEGGVRGASDSLGVHVFWEDKTLRMIASVLRVSTTRPWGPGPSQPLAQFGFVTVSTRVGIDYDTDHTPATFLR